MAEAGSRFGPYALLEKLGEGGMGEVWKALDTRLERVVALKLMKGQDELVRKSLLREAKTASQLTHPNIAVIYEAGEEAGVPYIAMEYVQGRTLLEELGTRHSEAEILALARQAAEALLHAHQRGVVHRDIKPENLVLTEGGHLEILDFGIAKRAPLEALSPASAPTMVHLTQPGVSMGTPAYMSPEQAYGRPLGPASDQFSLGVVLRELATGEPTFRREGLMDTLRAVAMDDPWRLADLRPDLSPDLCAALDRMIRKDPKDRFPDLGAFLAALPQGPGSRAAFSSPTLPGPTLPGSPSHGRGRFLAWAGALILLLSLGIAAVLALRGRRAPVLVGPKVVALLPVTLEPGDPQRSWVGVSLADAMNTSLLRRGDLKVLDRQWVAEAAHRKGWTGAETADGLAALASELKADLLIVGRCRMDGDRLEVRVRLVDPRGGSIPGEFVADGTQQGLLALEDRLASRLPDLMGLESARPSGDLDPGAGHQKARNLRTRELHARALELAERGNIDAYGAARTLFMEAIAAEPGYAPAHAGLAWALQDMGTTEAHLGRNEPAMAHFREAEASARRALELDPRSTLALRALGGALIRQSRFEEGRTVASRAVALDPVDHHAVVGLADTYAYSDLPADRAKARELYQQAVEIAPAYWYAHFRYAVMLQNEGELEDSVREADQASALQSSAEYSYLTSGLSLLWLGRSDEARARLETGLVQVPASKLLKLTLALQAHARGDAGAFQRLRTDLASAWPRGHIIDVLLSGLQLDLAGAPGRMRGLFLAEASRARATPWSARPASDRRGASVNLYHMARALALRRDRAAWEILDEAERLNPGKARVAAKDPAFQALQR
jgi:tetratricopeptide (TPR) repeat protein/TolB-like protein/predicted Ser/Thr protein kinase